MRRRPVQTTVEEVRATFLGHLAELRRRLLWVLSTFLGATLVAFLVRFEGTAPYVALDPYDNMAAQLVRKAAADLLPAGVELVATRPTDGIAANVQVALAIGLAVSLPMAWVQFGAFLKPALRPVERRTLLAVTLPSLALFVGGAAFAYTVLLPLALEALATFSANLGAVTLLQVDEFIAFVASTMLIVGLAFETPVLLYALARAGLVTPSGLVRKWRHAVVAILILAGVLTPDPTVVSQLLVAGPLLGLYFVGVLAAIPAARRFQAGKAAS